jgi:uncharacterized membrane protein
VFRKYDFLFIWAGILLLLFFLVIGQTSTSGILGSIRLVLGCIFVIFVPGYAILAVIQPKSSQIGLLERISLSFGLSIAVLSVMAIILDLLPWGITLWPIAIFLTGFMMVLTILAVIRRRSLSQEERFLNSSFNFIQWWQKQTSVLRVAFGAVVVVMIIAILSIVVLLTLPKPPYTEFYLLSPEGVADLYPSTLKNSVTVRLGIVNNESTKESYTIFILIDGHPLFRTDPILVDIDQRWENNFSIALPVDQTGHLLEYQLFRVGDSVPYRTLRLQLQAP